MNHNEDNLLSEMDESLCRVLQGAWGEKKFLDLTRWKEMLKAKEKLDKLLQEMGGEGSTVTIFPAFCSAGVSAEVDSVEVGEGEKERFFEVLESANNMEVLPLLNGQLRLSFVFRGVLYTEERKETGR